MSDPGTAFFEGLSWYLETRQWARVKIDTCPHGSTGQDIKMFHYLYFANLFGAIDLVDDHLVATEQVKRGAFRDEVKRNFAAPANFDFALELRDAIVHRGIDPAAAGHSDNQVIYVLCPTGISKRGQADDLPCTFTYTKELAAECDRAANTAIFQAIEQRGFLAHGSASISLDDTMSAVSASTAMPDWAKEMAKSALADMDFDRLAAELASSRIEKIRGLLGRPRQDGEAAA
ncbi:hypothetical protein [Novosphingobium sp. FKTRR1]|uniref:hypothetical protein n=1 Tax=Novosphingobium sp. FKTRR1 TaxID=2879118 RepID=UPI001CEFD555|nr:hypothetical protein [Novosphingobium sp. FKTRR1]